MTVNDSNRPCRLLIIDDEPIVGKRLQQVFTKIGFEVEIFTSGPPALESMAKHPFDIVVTDLKMAGMDGIEVLARVRAMNPEARVIIITGYAQPETASDAFERGVFEFIVKPFRLDQLKDVIIRAMADRELCRSRLNQDR
ncbi:MAG: hypothetical protein A2521_16620 [Deltaproteobacteria bacterium RIFOXYD12_FULL_57_12]|nr:MAG: hypothetical protein A2521_16620 [Deltaproteobacteria bacterium RIFOXYD12_FULL_57_12]